MQESEKNTILDMLHEIMKRTNDQTVIEPMQELYDTTIECWTRSNPPVNNN